MSMGKGKISRVSYLCENATLWATLHVDENAEGQMTITVPLPPRLRDDQVVAEVEARAGVHTVVAGRKVTSEILQQYRNIFNQ